MSKKTRNVQAEKIGEIRTEDGVLYLRDAETIQIARLLLERCGARLKLAEREIEKRGGDRAEEKKG